ncbi:DUF4949 domain-containing protein [Legionella jordanis]|uniref:Hemin binding protein n=1 Tax=Legionella jordanis TaxID=456 RepID=A0A0W0VCQ5_9GAMM|nr:DUF4949 domain-containing protein [Legionella jordanis]KTD17908.1 hemin binding protein [Legionella jordanis]RMX02393.1 DUF4949 domain-containing protein [Legionella jordanis]RMX21765.1 DUF4949 domain-containing protein [Legionella jordanis]VEH14001.1 hemin binding protein Hbp [Legionella jordanis]HAT8713878.1 DUF4949 domain-containing protein [Legionella jordanis]
MKFKAKFIAFTGALLLAGSSFAAFKAPPVCPSVSAIKAQGVSQAQQLIDHLYIDYEIHQYNTELNWVFAVGPFEGQSAEDALEVGNKALRYLSGNPISEPDEDFWVCLYELDNEHFAVALQSDRMPLPYKLHKYFTKKA